MSTNNLLINILQQSPFKSVGQLKLTG